MSKDKKKKDQTAPEPEKEPVGGTEPEEAEIPVSGTESDGEAPSEAEKPEDPTAELEKRIREEQDKYLRLAAEYDNFRKRSLKERDALRDDIRCAAIAELLPVYDNLERALAVGCSDEAFYKGVEMTMTQLKAIFESMGVTEIPAVGETFDPDLHNAVMHIDDEKYGAGEIVQQFQKGFRMGSKVIRFSMVQVAN